MSLTKKKKTNIYQKILGGVLLASTLTSGMLWLKVGKKDVPIPGYTTQRVIDGDTIETTEKQIIRLSGIQAPEKDLCGYAEAKANLEKLVLKKTLYIKILFRDPYNRLTALVYVDGKNISTAMLKSGWAVLNDRNNLDDPEMKQAAAQARDEKRGVFDSQCTQWKNPKQPNCDIKGNWRGPEKFYHLPSCDQYGLTSVQLYLGDEWFCSEKEAREAGYKKAQACP